MANEYGSNFSKNSSLTERGANSFYPSHASHPSKDHSIKQHKVWSQKERTRTNPKPYPNNLQPLQELPIPISYCCSQESLIISSHSLLQFARNNIALQQHPYSSSIGLSRGPFWLQNEHTHVSNHPISSSLIAAMARTKS